MGLVACLPADLPAAVFVVVHCPAESTSLLPQILSRKGPLKASHAEHGQKIVPGRIYVAPNDRHLLLMPGHMHLSRGPRENATRPAVDPLFRTAARAYASRVVGVVLSGTLDDGTVGLALVKAGGGVAVVQDPEEALYSGMPTSALQNVQVDHVLPVREIAGLLDRLAREEAPGSPSRLPPLLDYEIDVAEMEPEAILRLPPGGAPSGLTCPECRGSLWEVGAAESLHFRCRVGHSYSPETLFSEQADAVEAALWSAMQVLEERVQLAHRLEERMDRRGQHRIATRFREQAREADAQADVLRRVLLAGDYRNTEPVSGSSAGGESARAGD
jgi:two-component system chemotaxis response regulator CheB